MDGSIGFSSTQSIRNYPETWFPLKNKFYTNFGILRNFFFFNVTSWIFEKKAKWIGYLDILSDAHFISLQYEPNPILVSPKLGDPYSF